MAKRGKDPKFPKMPLAEAVGKARKLFEKAGQRSVTPLTAINALGYTSLNGASMSVLGSLNGYGLIDRGKDSVSITALALRAIKPVSPEDQRAAMAQLATTPALFEKIKHEYFDCDEGIIESQLVHQGLSEIGAKRAARVFAANREYLTQDEAEDADSEIDSQGVTDETPSSEATHPDQQSVMRPDTPYFSIPTDSDKPDAAIPLGITPGAYERLLQALDLFKGRIVRRPQGPQPDESGDAE